MTSRTVQRNGRILQTNDNQPTFWDKFENGSWEPETLAAIDRLVTPASTFIDIGAWVGPTSFWAAFTARRVIAIEADPTALAQFHQNLAINPELASRVEVIERALHISGGTIPMGARRKPGDSMSSIHFGSSQPHPAATTSWNIRTMTPIELVAHIGNDSDIVLKMDIEGGEYGLLPVMQPVLHRVRAALVSFHPEIMSSIGWSEEKLRAEERKAINAFIAFDHQPIVKQKADGPDSGKEWLFIKKQQK